MRRLPGSADLHNDIARLLLRLMTGGLMLFHGISKLGDGAALSWIGRQLSDLGLPSILSYGVYVGELVAPLMVLAGVFCRIGGVLMAVNMLFAVLLAHRGEFLALTENGGYALELQALFFLSAVAIALLGSGRFAVKAD